VFLFAAQKRGRRTAERCGIVPDCDEETLFLGGMSMLLWGIPSTRRWRREDGCFEAVVDVSDVRVVRGGEEPCLTLGPDETAGIGGKERGSWDHWLPPALPGGGERLGASYAATAPSTLRV